jgi:acetyl esterase/lipase
MPADSSKTDGSKNVSRRFALGGVVAVLAAGCSRLGFMAANVPAVFGSYKRHVNIAYGTDPQHRLDVYVPDKPAEMPGKVVGAPDKVVGAPDKAAASRPVVLFWHGGRWRFGDKSDYRFVGAALAESGYVVVVANYRHYPQVKMPGFMEDAAQAALWAAEHAQEFGGDPERLYLMGHSAGAHLAALVTLSPRYFAASGRPAPHIAGVIGLSGPYDFLPLLEADVQDMFGPPPLYPESQPINFLRADSPPMLLVHGLDDDTVRPKNSRNLAAGLSALGVPVTLKLYPKLSHADTVAALTTLLRGRAPILSDITTFVDQPAQAALAAAVAVMA